MKQTEQKLTLTHFLSDHFSNKKATEIVLVIKNDY